MENDTNPTPEANEDRPRYPLLFDADGVPLKLPPNAHRLRVRRLARHAGRPKMLIDSDTGRPLEIELDTQYEEFCDLVGHSGRYRLEVIDEQGRPIPRCVAITVVELGDAPESAPPPTNPVDVLAMAMQLVDKCVQSNTRVMEAMASAFGKVRPADEPRVIVAPGPDASAQQNAQMSWAQLMAGLPEMLQQVKAAWTAVKGQPNGAPSTGGNVP